MRIWSIYSIFPLLSTPRSKMRKQSGRLYGFMSEFSSVGGSTLLLPETADNTRPTPQQCARGRAAGCVRRLLASAPRELSDIDRGARWVCTRLSRHTGRLPAVSPSRDGILPGEQLPLHHRHRPPYGPAAEPARPRSWLKCQALPTPCDSRGCAACSPMQAHSRPKICVPPNPCSRASETSRQGDSTVFRR